MLLVIGFGCAGRAWAADGIVNRIVMLPLADRTTIVVELNAPVERVEDVQADSTMVVIEAGPVRGAVQPQELKPAVASRFFSGLTVTGVTRPDGSAFVRLRMALGAAAQHRLRSTGSRIYVDLAEPGPAAPPVQPAPVRAAPVKAAPRTPKAQEAPAAASEATADASYQALEDAILQRARELAARPDVKALLRLKAQVDRRDKELGKRRPEKVERIQAELLRYTDEARVLQLERDRRAFLKK